MTPCPFVTFDGPLNNMASYSISLKMSVTDLVRNELVEYQTTKPTYRTKYTISNRLALPGVSENLIPSTTRDKTTRYTSLVLAIMYQSSVQTNNNEDNITARNKMGEMMEVSFQMMFFHCDPSIFRALAVRYRIICEAIKTIIPAIEVTTTCREISSNIHLHPLFITQHSIRTHNG